MPGDQVLNTVARQVLLHLGVFRHDGPVDEQRLGAWYYSELVLKCFPEEIVSAPPFSHCSSTASKSAVWPFHALLASSTV